MCAFRVPGNRDNTDWSAPAIAGSIVAGIFFLSFLLALCRLCHRRTTTRVVRIRTQHPSISTQALIGPELGVAVGSELNSASRTLLTQSKLVVLSTSDQGRNTRVGRVGKVQGAPSQRAHECQEKYA